MHDLHETLNVFFIDRYQVWRDIWVSPFCGVKDNIPIPLFFKFREIFAPDRVKRASPFVLLGIKL